MRNKSIMQHDFSRVPQANIKRSVFNRISGLKTTFDEGYIVPVFVDEVLPGDTFNLEATFFARLATPIKPVMDNMRLESFFFFVPNRLVWTDWAHFMGEKDNPDDTTVYTIPQVVSPDTSGWAVGTLYDYLGLPTEVPGLSVSALFHRAYSLIYNEFFRDQNLQDSVVVDKDAGPDDPADYIIRRSAKAHDYFTSCLPWPQKGPGVELPLGDTADVIYGAPIAGTDVEGKNVIASVSSGTTVSQFFMANDNEGTGLGYYPGNSNMAQAPLLADLSNATAATINSLREAFQIQKMYEKDARGGTRYTEKIRAHFNVINPDFRLQRPEYLGGGVSPVNISPIAQTSVTATTPQGNLAGFGTTSQVKSGFTKSFTEHGIVLGLVRVRADLTYQQGIHKMFSRLTQYDFYWPSLAHLGEQEVLNKEIYAQGTGHTTDDDGVFGYQERYAEYRYAQSRITGKFRSTYSTSLDYWHLSQEFGSLPVLGASFIQEEAPMSRILAVNTEPHFLLDAYYKNISTRPMPVNSIPGLIDHF